MNAAILRKLGTAPRCEQFADPAAGEGEVLVHVHAAALKPVDKQLASGSHYAAPQRLPVVCGTDGVGHLSGGQRVFFGGCRPPYGAMAQRTVVPAAFTFPIPDGLDDATAAAIVNPGVSAWLSLSFRAKLARGENVLVLGATGTAGRLAVKIAKLLGAGRVVAAGRNPAVLNAQPQQGADAVVRLDQPAAELRNAFVREAGSPGFQVVIDFVWGEPTQQLLAALTRNEFVEIKSEIRLVQVGESAGPVVSLPAAVLRAAPLSILGTAGVPPSDVLATALREVMSNAARGELGVDTERVPLAEVEHFWQAQPRSRRLVVTNS
ncbi:MAG: quinone oxidoreductase family protein [Terriglobales bacterium]